MRFNGVKIYILERNPKLFFFNPAQMLGMAVGGGDNDDNDNKQSYRLFACVLGRFILFLFFFFYTTTS